MPAAKKVKHDEDAIKNMKQNVKDALKIQDQINTLSNEMEMELRQTHIKYEEKKKPIYQERAKLLEQIPDFWALALASHDLIQNMINDEDITMLKYCTNITVDQTVDNEKNLETLKAEFHFKENPFFTNTVLFKEVTKSIQRKKIDDKHKGCDDEECGANHDEEEEDEHLEIKQSGIDWKDEKKKKAKKDQEKKRKSEELDEGFFSIFENEGEMDADFCEMLHDEIMEDPIAFYLAATADEDVDVDEDDE